MILLWIKNKIKDLERYYDSLSKSFVLSGMLFKDDKFLLDPIKKKVMDAKLKDSVIVSTILHNIKFRLFQK